MTIALVSVASTMADESKTDEADAPSTVTVRVDTELVRMARIICAHAPGRGGNNLKLVDFLDSLLRDPITQRYNAVMRKIAEDQAGEPKKGRKPSS